MFFFVEQNSVYVVWHHDAVQHFQSFETSFHVGDTFFNHLSCAVQHQLPFCYMSEKFTPAFGHYRYKIAPYGGIIISSQP